jgi:hypothetical protein
LLNHYLDKISNKMLVSKKSTLKFKLKMLNKVAVSNKLGHPFSVWAKQARRRKPTTQIVLTDN